MPRGQLISPLYGHIEAAAIDAFLQGAPYTQRALATRIAAVTGEDVQALARRLPAFLKRLEKRGHYVSQPSAFGSKVGQATELTSPHGFNWSRLPFDCEVLREAAAAFLNAEDIDPTRKAAARSALRLVLELPTKCADDVILNGCSRITAEELYDLAIRAHDCALARGLNKQTAKNHRTAIRSVLRFAMESRSIPIVFPPLRPDSRWTELQSEYLPLAPVGRTDPFILTMRSTWTNLEETARLLFGEEIQFEDLTREMAEQVVTHLLLTERRRAVGYNVRRLCRHLAERHDAGPFVGDTGLDRFRVSTPAGPRPTLYLRGPNGEAADSDWDGLCGILTTLGFAESLVEFVKWYRRYVTLPSLDILSDPEFPPRRQRHMISDKTSFERLTALRAILGAAVYELKTGPDEDDYVGLQLPPQEVTPELVFGERFTELVQAILDWWSARAKHLPADAIGKGTSGSLRQTIINLGMFAFGHYERLRHRRKLRSATRKTPSGIEVVDTLAEEGAEKTAAETAAWDAYVYANQLADALTDLSKDRKGRSRKRANEFRDIRRILKHTPPEYWIRLQEGMIELFRDAKHRGSDVSYAYHSLVLNAVTLGLLISTGCRIEELCLVRLDIQFSRGERRIVLRAIDRKNGTPHTVLIHEAFLPDDLLDEYLERSRPWFIAGMPQPHSGGRKRRKKKRSPVEPHEFLLVSTSGRPYATIGETRDGENRDEAEMKRRANQAGQRFQTQMARVARSLKMKLPKTKYEFGPHSVRGACGYGMFLVYDEKAAAQYLGDTIETVRDAYSAIDGAHVDSSCLVGFQVGPVRPAPAAPAPPAVPAAPAAPSDYAADLKELTSDFKNKLLTREEFDMAKAALSRRFHVGPKMEAA